MTDFMLYAVRRVVSPLFTKNIYFRVWPICWLFCLQLPEDEESTPPILQYNNHMRSKDMWVCFVYVSTGSGHWNDFLPLNKRGRRAGGRKRKEKKRNKGDDAHSVLLVAAEPSLGRWLFVGIMYFTCDEHVWKQGEAVVVDSMKPTWLWVRLQSCDANPVLSSSMWSSPALFVDEGFSDFLHVSGSSKWPRIYATTVMFTLEAKIKPLERWAFRLFFDESILNFNNIHLEEWQETGQMLEDIIQRSKHCQNCFFNNIWIQSMKHHCFDHIM